MVKRSIEQDLRNRNFGARNVNYERNVVVISSKELAPIHSEKLHPPECLFYKTKSGCRFGEKCSYAHRQVDEQLSERSKKNDDKSAAAMLKKNELHDRKGQPVVNRDTRHESNHGPVGCRSKNTRQLGNHHQSHGKCRLCRIMLCPMTSLYILSASKRKQASQHRDHLCHDIAICVSMH